MQKPYTLIVLQVCAFVVARIPVFPNREDWLCTLNIFFHVLGRITRQVKGIDKVKMTRIWNYREPEWHIPSSKIEAKILEPNSIP